jgi:hypothetical protein
MNEPITEEWRPVPGYEGIYEVSNLGRIYSVKRFGVSRSGHLLKPGVMASGHLSIGLRRGAGVKVKRYGVHRLVMLAFVGPCPEGMETRHLDGDPANNGLNNLRYGTRSENMLDRFVHNNPTGQPHCPKGHPYAPENTYRISTRPGMRCCRTCRDARLAARRGQPVTPRPERWTPIEHGTSRGYGAHFKRKQPIPAGDPCGCRRAHAVAAAARKARRRAA